MKAKGQIEASVNQTDPGTALDIIVGESGKVSEEYGGFLIEISDTQRFPWVDVCRLLLRLGYMVWMEIRNDKLFVVSKPKAD